MKFKDFVDAMEYMKTFSKPPKVKHVRRGEPKRDPTIADMIKFLHDMEDYQKLTKKEDKKEDKKEEKKKILGMDEPVGRAVIFTLAAPVVGLGWIYFTAASAQIVAQFLKGMLP